jgi:hypothetical protein
MLRLAFGFALTTNLAGFELIIPSTIHLYSSLFMLIVEVFIVNVAVFSPE